MEKGRKVTEINDLGEFGLIEALNKYAHCNDKSTVLGIGDDAALVDHNGFETVVTTDLLLEGIHFDLVYTPLKHLGYKAVVVNLSDVYAMMAEPKQITVSLGISNKFSVEAIETLYSGIEKACAFYEVDLIGGDTTASMTGLVISVTALGVVESGKAIKRSTAKADDLICVSGDLGAAYLGLQILEREKQIYLENKNIQPDLETNKYLIERILKPEARRDVIRQLKAANIVPTSMIDISDGLSSEVMHLCTQSKTGCVIYDENIPINPEAIQQALQFKIDPSVTALNGGEDYELLFTIDKKDLNKIESIFDVKVIGKMIAENEGMNLVTQSGKTYPLTAQGWQSFREVK